MGLGQVALGFASLVLGVHHLRNGARHLAGTGLAGDTPLRTRARSCIRPGTPRSVRVPGRPFMDSGRVLTGTGRDPMRMRSFNIRTLEDRIQYLNGLVDEGKRDPRVYAFARRATSKKCGNRWCVPEKDNLAEARALFGDIRRHIPPTRRPDDLFTAKTLFGNIRHNVRYTSDIEGVDTYQKPSNTLALRSGDCDDFSSLTCAALGSLGIPCRFKVIRTKNARDWNHIYPQAGFPRQRPTRWVSMDSSVDMPFGWEAPRSMVAASRTFRVR